MNLPAASYGVSICHFNILTQQAAGYLTLRENKKPLICQAGSAEAFAGSTATGREQDLRDVLNLSTYFFHKAKV